MSNSNPSNKRFSVERGIFAFAGFMILFSEVLTFYVHEDFFWLSLFVGINLFQSALTGFCPAAIILNKLFDVPYEKELNQN